MFINGKTTARLQIALPNIHLYLLYTALWLPCLSAGGHIALLSVDIFVYRPVPYPRVPILTSLKYSQVKISPSAIYIALCTQLYHPGTLILPWPQCIPIYHPLYPILPTTCVITLYTHPYHPLGALGSPYCPVLLPA